MLVDLFSRKDVLSLARRLFAEVFQVAVSMHSPAKAVGPVDHALSILLGHDRIRPMELVCACDSGLAPNRITVDGEHLAAFVLRG